MVTTIRPLRDSEVWPAASTLATAFESYPWTRWTVPAEDHAGRLAELQRLYLEHALGHGVVLTTEDLDGVIALMPPAPPLPSDSVQQRIAALHGDRVGRILSMNAPGAPDGFWTVETLGVAPGSRGAGIGSSLLASGLAAVPRAAGFALQTSDERNVRLYRRAGFEVAATTAVAPEVTVYSMTMTKDSHPCAPSD